MNTLNAESAPPTLEHGRFEGQPLESVPTGLLRWLLVFDVEGARLREAIKSVIESRARA